MRNLTLAMIVLAAFGCARGGRPRARRSPVTVTESGLALALAPRPADCVIEFYRTTLPERPYDEVATLHLRATVFATPQGAQEKMREQACALGADAVLITREFVPGTQYTPSLMTGAAVSYRDARERHRIDAALRKAEADRVARIEEERKAAAARAEEAAVEAVTTAGAKGPPAGFVRGRLKESVLLRATADRRGIEKGDLPGGAEVWMAPQPSSGWRRVWADGATGWVEDSSVVPPERVEAPRPDASRPADDAPPDTTDI